MDCAYRKELFGDALKAGGIRHRIAVFSASVLHSDQ